MGLYCPKCSSDQITAQKKGFSGKKAVAGAVLTGGIGILAGTLGSNKVKITCLACGHQFNPGEGRTTKPISSDVKNTQAYRDLDAKIAENQRKSAESSSSSTLSWVIVAGLIMFLVYQCG